MNFGEYSCRYTNPTYPLIRNLPNITYKLCIQRLNIKVLDDSNILQINNMRNFLNINLLTF